MVEFEIKWLTQYEPPTGHSTFVEAEDFAGAVWEATRLLRAKITHQRAAVNVGLYGIGFCVTSCVKPE